MTQTINNTHVGPVSFAISSCHHKINDARTQTWESQYTKMNRPQGAYRGKLGWNTSAEDWFMEQCEPVCSLHAARFLCGGYPK